MFYHSSFLFFILFVTHISSTTSFECESNFQCNSPNGKCQDNKCVCYLYYSGSTCDDDWRDDKTWFSLFWVYDAVILLGFCVTCVFGGYQMYITVRYQKVGGWTIWNVPTIALLITWVGALARVIEFAGDPHGIRNAFPKTFEQILFASSLLLFLNAGLMLFLNLLEVMQQKGIERLAFLRKYRWWFIGLSFFMTVLCLLAGVWTTLSDLSRVSVAVLNACFGIALIIVSIVGIALGVTVFRLVRQMENLEKLSGRDLSGFLKKLLRFLGIVSCFAILIVITIIIQGIVNGYSNRWAFLIFNIIYRGCELLIIQQFASVIMKRVPKREDTEKEISMTLSRSATPAIDSESAFKPNTQ